MIFCIFSPNYLLIIKIMFWEWRNSFNKYIGLVENKEYFPDENEKDENWDFEIKKEEERKWILDKLNSIFKKK